MCSHFGHRDLISRNAERSHGGGMHRLNAAVALID